jgi:hypothetical protein
MELSGPFNVQSLYSSTPDGNEWLTLHLGGFVRHLTLSEATGHACRAVVDMHVSQRPSLLCAAFRQLDFQAQINCIKKNEILYKGASRVFSSHNPTTHVVPTNCVL